MPFGLVLDLRERHKQYRDVSNPKVEVFINDIIPEKIYKNKQFEIFCITRQKQFEIFGKV